MEVKSTSMSLGGDGVRAQNSFPFILPCGLLVDWVAAGAIGQWPDPPRAWAAPPTETPELPPLPPSLPYLPGQYSASGLL